MSESCSNGSSSYDPTDIVNAFHNIPHVDIDLKDSSSQFDITLDYFQVSSHSINFILMYYIFLTGCDNMGLCTNISVFMYIHTNVGLLFLYLLLLLLSREETQT